jgi:hypothetical protein
MPTITGRAGVSSRTSHWRCGACETVNASSLDACLACGSPAAVCGSVLPEDAAATPTTVVIRPDAPPVRSPEPAKPVYAAGCGPAQAGSVLGIVGAVVSLIPFTGIVLGSLLAVLAIVFSGVALSLLPVSSPSRKNAVLGLTLGLLTIASKFIPGVREL